MRYLVSICIGTRRTSACEGIGGGYHCDIRPKIHAPTNTRVRLTAPSRHGAFLGGPHPVHAVNVTGIS